MASFFLNQKTVSAIFRDIKYQVYSKTFTVKAGISTRF